MTSELNQMKKGYVVPLFKTIQGTNAIDYFIKLSDYGRKQNSILLESVDIVPKYGEFSLGTSDPCLKVYGQDKTFTIVALNSLGERFLKYIKSDFSFCDKVKYTKNKVTGVLKPVKKIVNEEERLKLKTHIDIIRTIAFKFKPTDKPFIPYCGLFGAISYDFIDQFEKLPKNKKDLLKTPDYVMYFMDNLFLTDHKAGKTHIISNALMMDDDSKKEHSRCMNVIEDIQKTISEKLPNKRKFKKEKKVFTTDTVQDEFMKIVKDLKKHISSGDIFQVVPSRTITVNYDSEELDIYKKLRALNPSPYMFFINNGDDILLGASPEMSLRVQGDKEKTVEIRPIAGTKPRGIVNGKIDDDLDSRYEVELKIDEKELAEHTMLIDLARNDVARISKSGSRVVNEPFIVEKYSHVQHLVSNVKGVLKDNLDALHAYLASMNMGTLTGAPKVEAMKLIRSVEKTKRNYYGGAVGYITPSGDLDSTIVIRSMILKNRKAYVRAGAGVVFDSIPEKEFDETEKKAKACLKALEEA